MILMTELKLNHFWEELKKLLGLAQEDLGASKYIYNFIEMFFQ